MGEHLTTTPDSRDRAASGWPGLRYGELEKLLVAQTGGDQRSVLARFRNLRQMPFPDAIKTGTGNKVEYDLPRVLALSTVFELGAMTIPQSQAVAIVRDTWPELVRGLVAAAVELGHLDRPRGMPRDATAIVTILPDGFAPAGAPAATASWKSVDGKEGHESVISLRVDCRASLARIVEHVPGSSDGRALALALADLDRTFGWSPGDVPHRGATRDLFAGASFLDRGPYLERAAALLRVAVVQTGEKTPLAALRGRSMRSAQNLLDYLGKPSPVDVWKGEIGTEEGRPRLKHLLAAVAEDVGLEPVEKWPATITGTAISPAAQAAALIQRATAIEKLKQHEEAMTTGG